MVESGKKQKQTVDECDSCAEGEYRMQIRSTEISDVVSKKGSSARNEFESQERIK